MIPQSSCLPLQRSWERREYFKAKSPPTESLASPSAQAAQVAPVFCCSKRWHGRARLPLRSVGRRESTPLSQTPHRELKRAPHSWGATGPFGPTFWCNDEGKRCLHSNWVTKQLPVGSFPHLMGDFTAQSGLQWQPKENFLVRSRLIWEYQGSSVLFY